MSPGTVELVSYSDVPRCDFADFLRTATLRSVRRLIDCTPEGLEMLVAVCDGRVIGCTGLIRDHQLMFRDSRGGLSNMVGGYFCSTEVAMEWRGSGVGAALYAQRLQLAEVSVECALVEILGDGRPGTVHPLSVRGLLWHRARGFEVLGQTLDVDAGPILGRRF